MFLVKERCIWVVYFRGGLEIRKEVDVEFRRVSFFFGFRVRRKEGKNLRENFKEELVRLGIIDVRFIRRVGVGVCVDSLGGGFTREERLWWLLALKVGKRKVGLGVRVEVMRVELRFGF